MYWEYAIRLTVGIIFGVWPIYRIRKEPKGIFNGALLVLSIYVFTGGVLLIAQAARSRIINGRWALAPICCARQTAPLRGVDIIAFLWYQDYDDELIRPDEPKTYSIYGRFRRL